MAVGLFVGPALHPAANKLAASTQIFKYVFTFCSIVLDLVVVLERFDYDDEEGAEDVFSVARNSRHSCVHASIRHTAR